MSARSDAPVVAVVQARMSSSRLPGKVLTGLGSAPALWHVLNRLAAADELAAVILATSVEPSDDPIASFGDRFGVPVHRGPLDDVLARFIGAIDGAASSPAAVVRITADCPFVDPGLVDRLVRVWREGNADYVADVIEPRTFPKGLDVEVVGVGALRTAAAEARDQPDREHVTMFVRDRPERFPQEGLWLDPPMPEVRVTLDTQEDLEALSSLVMEVGEDPDLVTLVEALGGSGDFEIAAVPPSG